MSTIKICDICGQNLVLAAIQKNSILTRCYYEVSIPKNPMDMCTSCMDKFLKFVGVRTSDDKKD